MAPFKAIVSRRAGQRWSWRREGTVGVVGRAFASGEKELYPAWQGTQYMRNMFDGQGPARRAGKGRVTRSSAGLASGGMLNFYAREAA